MGNISKYDDLTMYNTWVAFGRNASQAAKSLGLEPAALQWHVREKNFQQKYLLEYGGLAEGTMRAGIVKAMLAIPEMVDELVEMAKVPHTYTDPQTGELRNSDKLMIAKVKAIDTLTKFLPIIPEKLDDFGLSDIETTGVIVDQNISPEDEIRTALESNIVEAAEARSRPKR